jgi:hypothetical protein
MTHIVMENAKDGEILLIHFQSCFIGKNNLAPRL